jgi:hypothetical protein
MHVSGLSHLVHNNLNGKGKHQLVVKGVVKDKVPKVIGEAYV